MSLVISSVASAQSPNSYRFYDLRNYGGNIPGVGTDQPTPAFVGVELSDGAFVAATRQFESLDRVGVWNPGTVSRTTANPFGYSFQLLPNPAGYGQTYLWGMSALGKLAGRTMPETGLQQGFTWNNSVFTIHPPVLEEKSEIFDVNDSGYACGEERDSNSNQNKPILVTPQGSFQLPVWDGFPNGAGQANALTASGTPYGWIATASSSSGGQITRPAYWTDPFTLVFSDNSLFDSTTNAMFVDVNGSGTGVGSYFVVVGQQSQQRGFIWDAQSAPVALQQFVPIEINDSNWILGKELNGARIRFPSGTFYDLPSGSFSGAQSGVTWNSVTYESINNHGWVSGVGVNTFVGQQRLNRPFVAIPQFGEATITVTVSLSDLADPAEAAGEPISWSIRQAGYQQEAGVATLSLVGSSYQFQCSTTLRGPIEVFVKGTTWLQRKSPTISLPTNSSSGATSVILLNGDCDGDNVVTVFDYIMISDAFDTSVGQSGYNPLADLDQDGSVTIFDYNILSGNFDTAGDE